MFKFLGASAIVNTVVDFLGIAGIVIFGSFIVTLVIDLILAANNDHEGVFFNKKKGDSAQSLNDEVVVFNNTPAPDAQPVQSQPVQDSVEEDGIVFYNRPYDESQVTAIDFDKAAEEQASLQGKLNEKEEPVNTYFEQPEEVEEEDIEAIALEVSKKAVKELEEEAKVKEKKVFKVKEVEEPIVEEEINEPIFLQPVEEKQNNDEAMRVLEEQRRELEKQVALLHEERARDKEEILKTLQELRDKEPVVIENDNKEEEEKRKLANITRMNSRLSRVKASTRKIENRPKEDKTPKVTKQTVVTVETNNEEPKKVFESVEVVEEKHEKPRFKKAYYENRLEVLQQELKEVEAEYKLNRKDFGPLEKVHKTFARDDAKLRRQEAIVAKQQVSVYGVNKKSKISKEKKEKLEENIKQLKQLKESVYSCKQVIEQNKDRYPILEKNNRLLEKQIKRLTEDIESVNEALQWYEENN